jgi:hypothetical protein
VYIHNNSRVSTQNRGQGEGVVNLRRSGNMSDSAVQRVPGARRGVLNQEQFQRMVSVERRRIQRSGKALLLMLVEIRQNPSENDTKILRKVLLALASSARETDVTGWYKANAAAAVLFTDVATDDRNFVLKTILTRVSETVRNYLTSQQFSQISTSFHFFPEGPDNGIPVQPRPPVSVPTPTFLPATSSESSAL